MAAASSLSATSTQGSIVMSSAIMIGATSATFNAPCATCDVTIDGKGRLYFTDPNWGDAPVDRVGISGVYRIDLDGKVTRILCKKGEAVAAGALLVEAGVAVGADDIVITYIALRSVVRHAGESALETHWPGTPEGLAALRRLAGC